MDHTERTQKNSIESRESGYGSVESTSNTTKCDICDEVYSEPIVIWFSNEQKTEHTAVRGSTRSSIVSVGYVCHGCFVENSPNMAEKLKQKSRLQGYKHTR